MVLSHDGVDDAEDGGSILPAHQLSLGEGPENTREKANHHLWRGGRGGGVEEWRSGGVEGWRSGGVEEGGKGWSGEGVKGGERRVEEKEVGGGRGSEGG